MGYNFISHEQLNTIGLNKCKMIKKILIKSASDIMGIERKLNLFESILFYTIAVGSFVVILMIN